MGGIDNVILPVFLDFDLDLDDNSGAFVKDYRANRICYTGGLSAITDSDLVVRSMLPIDSILIENTTTGNLGSFVWTNLDTSKVALQWRVGVLVLKNKGSAKDVDFSTLIQQLKFELVESLLGEDVVLTFAVFAGGCGPYTNIRTTIPIYNARYVGLNTDTVLCDYSAPVNLGNLAKINTTLQGAWTPNTSTNDGVFVPNLENNRRFVFKTSALWGCKADSIFLKINLVKRADSILPNLKYLCKDQRLDLRPVRAYEGYLWNTGATTSGIRVEEGGLYAVTVVEAQCQFADTVDLSLVTCTSCQFYVPNIFTPNNDGKNDDFGVLSNCIPERYRLQIFSRWGERVFVSEEINKRWDGTFKGKKMDDGVFVFHWSATYEYYGTVYQIEKQGDVALISWEQN
jgi:gliding motility-associated-like protein